VREERRGEGRAVGEEGGEEGPGREGQGEPGRDGDVILPISPESFYLRI